MDMIARIGGKARPTEFEPDMIVINVWGEMILAMIYFDKAYVVKSGDDGWDIRFEELDITSFPYREITEGSLPRILSEHPAEVAIVGAVPPDGVVEDDDDDFDWEDASDMTEALFVDGGTEVARCSSCRFVMHTDKHWHKA